MAITSGALAAARPGEGMPARIGPLRLTADNASVAFAVSFLHAFPIRGHFRSLDGEVAFDAARPSDAALRARLEVASIATGNRLRDAHLRSAGWFDARRHPLIDLRARRVEPAGPGLRILAALRIRGREAPVEIACTASRDGGSTTLTGRVVLARSAFGLGPPPRGVAPWDPRAYLVGDAVSVELRLRLDR